MQLFGYTNIQRGPGILQAGVFRGISRLKIMSLIMTKFIELKSTDWSSATRIDGRSYIMIYAIIVEKRGSKILNFVVGIRETGAS